MEYLVTLLRMVSDKAPAAGAEERGRRVVMTTALVLVLAVVLLVVAAVRIRDYLAWGPTAVPRLVPTSTRFFADPGSSAARWVRSHPDDGRVGVIRDRIASQPQGVWFTTGDPLSVQAEVHQVTAAAEARSEIPVLVMYAIPHRDCARHSAGGAPGLAAYRQWVQGFSKGLDSLPAWVVLEPDSLAQVGCLTARQRAARFRAVADAARVLRERNPSARVYFDAGHSGWHSAETMAARLQRSGVSEYGAGIALNVANFNRTDDEVRYGLAVIRSLGDRNLRMVVDTGRNGNGEPSDRQTCDPSGRRLGTAPTADTRNAWVDAFLWVKPPGQADGCRGAAGSFLPQDAHELADKPRP